MNGLDLPEDQGGWNALGLFALLGAAVGALAGGTVGWGVPGWSAIAVCALLGLTGLLYRSGQHLSFVDRELRRWTWRPHQVTWRKPLDWAREVILGCRTETIRGKHPVTFDVFTVTLRGAGQELKLSESGDLPTARAFSERLSRGLMLDCRNLTVDPAEVRRPADLDRPLGERTKLDEVRPKLPRRPLQASYERTPEGLCVRMRHLLKPDWSVPLVTVVGVGVLATLFLWFLCGAQWDAPVVLGVGIGVTLVASAPELIKTWKAARLDETVRVTATHLELGSRKIPLAQLEELCLFEVRDKPLRRGLDRFYEYGHLWALSDRAELRFGGGLSREELEYLRDLLRQEISQRFQL